MREEYLNTMRHIQYICIKYTYVEERNLEQVCGWCVEYDSYFFSFNYVRVCTVLVAPQFT